MEATTKYSIPGEKNVLIDYETPGHLSGFNNFDEFQSAHKQRIESALSDNKM